MCDGEYSAMQKIKEQKKEINRLRTLLEDCGWCPDCEGLIEIRNPTGKCDHLYYPDNKNKKRD